MKLVVGLGNPGTQYAGTRHNVGFEVLRALAAKYGKSTPRARFQGETVEGQIGDEKVLLLTPLTYMNLSGGSVLAARDFYKIENENLLQAPLYLMAAGRRFGLRPEAMYYIGLKGGVEYAQWEAAGDWEARAVEKTMRIVAEIRAGRIAVAPADTDKCRFCDAKDICRIEIGAAVAAAEGA